MLDLPYLRAHRLAHRVEGPRTPHPAKTAIPAAIPAIAVVRELDPGPIEETSTRSHEPRLARAIVTRMQVHRHLITTPSMVTQVDMGGGSRTRTQAEVCQNQPMNGTDGTAGTVRFRGCHGGPVEWHVREHHTFECTLMCRIVDRYCL